MGADMNLTPFGGTTEAYAGLMAGRREVISGIQNRLMTLVLPFFPVSTVLKLTSWFHENRVLEP
jgi:hypothetical protein